jgi:hypothetical protein
MGEPLRDPAVFRQVRVDPELRTIVRPNGSDLDPDVLHGRSSPDVSPAAPEPASRVAAHRTNVLPDRHPGPRCHLGHAVRVDNGVVVMTGPANRRAAHGSLDASHEKGRCTAASPRSPDTMPDVRRFGEERYQPALGFCALV